MPSELPPDAKDLIKRMLEVDPAKRITVSVIFPIDSGCGANGG